MPPESRSRRLRLEDILTAALRIQSYTAGMSAEDFGADLKTMDAVVRNFEVMGEAARHLDDEFVAAHAEVAWREGQGLPAPFQRRAADGSLVIPDDVGHLLA